MARFERGRLDAKRLLSAIAERPRLTSRPAWLVSPPPIHRSCARSAWWSLTGWLS